MVAPVRRTFNRRYDLQFATIDGRKRACFWTTRRFPARPSSEHEQSVIVVAVGRGCGLYRQGPAARRGKGATVGRVVGDRPSVGTVRRGWFPSKHTTCKRQLPDTRPHQAIVTVPASLLHLAPSRCSLLSVDRRRRVVSCRGMHGFVISSFLSPLSFSFSVPSLSRLLSSRTALV